MMYDLEDEVAKGNKAAEVVRNEEFQNAFEALEEYYLEQWKRSEPEDVALRERLYIAAGTLHHIRLHLESLMMTGKMASEQIEAGSAKIPLH
jgi:hypothetical protein